MTEAAEQLTRIMLESISDIAEEQRLFTLTDYRLYEQVCYSAGETNETAVPGLRLPEDTWVFSPEYTFDYTGRTFFAERGDCAAKGLIAEDGFVKNVHQGMPENMYYVLMKQGNVWRMEKLSVMLSYVAEEP